MTKAEQQFLSILRSTIHPKILLTNDNPEWTNILTIARKQNLFPLIFDATSFLPCYETIEVQYFGSVVARISIQAQKTTDFLFLYQSFLEHNISPIVLKGIICRSLYGERADFRISGG